MQSQQHRHPNCELLMIEIEALSLDVCGKAHIIPTISLLFRKLYLTSERYRAYIHHAVDLSAIKQPTGVKTSRQMIVNYTVGSWNIIKRTAWLHIAQSIYRAQERLLPHRERIIKYNSA